MGQQGETIYQSQAAPGKMYGHECHARIDGHVEDGLMVLYGDCIMLQGGPQEGSKWFVAFAKVLRVARNLERVWDSNMLLRLCWYLLSGPHSVVCSGIDPRLFEPPYSDPDWIRGLAWEDSACSYSGHRFPGLPN